LNLKERKHHGELSMAAQIQDVKQQAAGRWGEILQVIGGIDASYLTGMEQPCPKCEGNQRWRFTDFKDEGGAVCNKCGKFGDGIAVLEWFTGQTTFEVVEAVAKHLGVSSAPATKKKHTTNTKTKTSNHHKKKQQGEPKWKKDIKWGPMPKKLVAIWCSRKQPIDISALSKCNAKYGVYRSRDAIIGIPILNEDSQEVGYAVYNATGGTLEYYPAGLDGPIEFLKIKNCINKGESGWMGRYLPGEGLVVKTEGPTDMLALLTIAPDDVSIICNPHGSTETPTPWMVSRLTGRKVWTVHDCDVAGQEGATYVENANKLRPGWSVAFAAHAAESRNIVLPYEIVDSHGKDLRDWIREQLDAGKSPQDTWEAFVQMGEGAELVQPEDDDDSLVEDVDNPSHLARVNLENYQAKYGGTLKFWKDEWWRYKGGKYTRLSNSEIEAKIHTSIRLEFERDFLERKKRNEEVDSVRHVNVSLVRNVVAATKERCLLPGSVNQPCWLDDETQPHWVSVQNGILDLQAIFEGRDVSEHLRPHSPQWFSSTQLKYKYDPEATCQRWDDYLDYTMEGDGERMMLLQEWAGYLLASSNYLQRFLALYGDGSNGKSVFFGAMIAMIGADNVGHVPLESFGGRFDLGTLVGKVANICGDVGEIDSLAEGILKQFTGGDPMQFDRKGIAPIICRPTAKLMMSFNNPPKIKDKSKGVWRRMILVPFNKTIDATKMIRHMDTPEFWLDSGEVSGILNWAIRGLQRLRDQREFTRSAASDEAIEAYRRENNPILDFFDEFIQIKKGSNLKISNMYEVYKHWCEKMGFRAMSVKSMGVEVKRVFGDIRDRETTGSREWVYRGLDFSVEEVLGKQTDEPPKLKF
jgi:P4 family phage/plasmid primase-like protien